VAALWEHKEQLMLLLLLLLLLPRLPAMHAARVGITVDYIPHRMARLKVSVSDVASSPNQA